MQKVEELYRLVIMDHYKNPRNKGLINNSEYLTVSMSNPSCGDELVMQLLIKDNVITHIVHDGKGCSICCASSSVASQKLVGKTVGEALDIINNFYELVKGESYDENLLNQDELAFRGVASFPARIKCATLAWKAVEKGLKKDE